MIFICNMSTLANGFLARGVVKGKQAAPICRVAKRIGTWPPRISSCGARARAMSAGYACRHVIPLNFRENADGVRLMLKIA